MPHRRKERATGSYGRALAFKERSEIWSGVSPAEEKVKQHGFVRQKLEGHYRKYQFFTIATFVLILIGTLLAIGYLARLVRVFIQDKKTMDGHLINAETFGRSNLIEQYAAASYCPLNSNSSQTKVTCAAGNCPLAEAVDTTTEVPNRPSRARFGLPLITPLPLTTADKFAEWMTGMADFLHAEMRMAQARYADQANASRSPAPTFRVGDKSG